jgi:hypothetical protein
MTFNRILNCAEIDAQRVAHKCECLIVFIGSINIFDKALEIRLEDMNQQLKKWIYRWRPVIDHSMKRV